MQFLCNDQIDLVTGQTGQQMCRQHRSHLLIVLLPMSRTGKRNIDTFAEIPGKKFQSQLPSTGTASAPGAEGSNGGGSAGSNPPRTVEQVAPGSG